MSFPGQAVQRAWHLVDASNQTVGRLAQQVSQILKGKHKPTYRPNKDMGDYVIVINAEKVRKKYSEKEMGSFCNLQHIQCSK
jgi:large subunit ribosomal protein L13